MFHYIEVVIGVAKKVFVGPYDSVANLATARIKLKDAGEHGFLFDASSVYFMNDFSSIAPLNEAIDEGEFLKIAANTCRECGDIFEEGSYIIIRTHCTSFSPARKCSKCGRLHWEGGELVFNRQDNAAFHQDGRIIHKDRKGNIVD